MGQCYSTPPRVANSRDNKKKKPIGNQNQHENANLHRQVSIRKHDSSLEKQVYNRILNNVRRIANPTDLVPQVCVGDDSFPLITAVFQLNEPDVNDIRLPIVSCAIKGNGRIACISSLDFLSPQYFQLFDTNYLLSKFHH